MLCYSNGTDNECVMKGVKGNTVYTFTECYQKVEYVCFMRMQQMDISGNNYP